MGANRFPTQEAVHLQGRAANVDMKSQINALGEWLLQGGVALWEEHVLGIVITTGDYPLLVLLVFRVCSLGKTLVHASRVLAG